MKMKITKRQCFWSAAAVLYVLFIFSNSMKNADLSSADSGAVLRLVQQVLTAGGVDGTIITEHVIRKTAHFTEYAALGILLCLCTAVFCLRCWQAFWFRLPMRRFSFLWLAGRDRSVMSGWTVREWLLELSYLQQQLGS